MAGTSQSGDRRIEPPTADAGRETQRATPVAATKRIIDSDKARGVFCFLFSLYMRLVRVSGRWRFVGLEEPERMIAAGETFVVAFWHGRMFMMPFLWGRKPPFYMLISQHRDGELIARTIAHFDLKTVRGSSRRGGAGALRALVRVIAEGGYVGMTPDGPKGPRMRAQDGIVMVARLAGVPIVPVTFAARWRIAFGSWDRFVLPLPFGGGVFNLGRPIFVPRDASPADLEDARRRVEDELNRLTHEADQAFGLRPVEPAPVSAA